MPLTLRAPLKNTVSTLAAVALLSACSVTTSLRDTQNVAAPATVRNFSLGQPAEVYFAEFTYFHSAEADLEAWRKTGLFSSVTRAATDEPLKNGIFIRVKCTEGSTESTSGLMGIMWLLTLGLVPAGVKTEKSYCNLAMYQNTLKIAETTANINYTSVWSSWFIIPELLRKDKQAVIYQQDTAAIRVNNLLAAASK
jgi:hypothetical protein